MQIKECVTILHKWFDFAFKASFYFRDEYSNACGSQDHRFDSNNVMFTVCVSQWCWFSFKKNIPQFVPYNYAQQPEVLWSSAAVRRYHGGL